MILLMVGIAFGALGPVFWFVAALWLILACIQKYRDWERRHKL
jgi:hypothetical protein